MGAGGARRVLGHAAGHRLGVLFEVLAMTGLRRGEVVGLRWGDVSLEKRVLWVRQAVVHGIAAPLTVACTLIFDRWRVLGSADPSLLE